MLDYIEAKKLVQDALKEFAHSECPYCQVDINLDKYIDDDDIEKWLKKRSNIVVVYTQHV